MYLSPLVQKCSLLPKVTLQNLNASSAENLPVQTQTDNRDQKLFSFRQALNCHFSEEKRLVQFLFISGCILWSDISLEFALIHAVIWKWRTLYPLKPEHSLASDFLLLFGIPDCDLGGYCAGPANVKHSPFLQNKRAVRENLAFIFFFRQNFRRDFFLGSELVYVPFGSCPPQHWCQHWLAKKRIILEFSWVTVWIDINMSYLLILLLLLPGLMTALPISSLAKIFSQGNCVLPLWTIKGADNHFLSQLIQFYHHFFFLC